MNQQQMQQANQYSSYGRYGNYAQNYISDSFMRMRLDTSTLIKDIQNFLSNKRTYLTQNKDGTFIEEVEQVGQPLANDEGIMRICNIINMRVNHHVVQGNLKDEHYWYFQERARKEITETIVKKCYDWGIEDSDLNTVIDEIMALIEIFLTRPVDNKERESLMQGFASKEVLVNSPQKSGALSGFFSGGKNGGT